MSDGPPTEATFGPQENLTPQQAFDELIKLTGQIDRNPWTDSTPRKDYRRKVFRGGDILEIEYTKSTTEHPTIKIIAFRANEKQNTDLDTDLACSFDIDPEGLLFFQLHLQRISIGGRDNKDTGVEWVMDKKQGSPSRLGIPTHFNMPTSMIPLQEIVDWVRNNVASPTYVPFPPITLSS